MTRQRTSEEHAQMRAFVRSLSVTRRRVEPRGEIWEQEITRRGGRPYQGGPVCWSQSECDGTCRDCLRGTSEEAAS